MYTNASRFSTDGQRAAEAWHAANDAMLIEAMRAEARSNHAAMLNQFGSDAYDFLASVEVQRPETTLHTVQQVHVGRSAGPLAVAA